MKNKIIDKLAKHTFLYAALYFIGSPALLFTFVLGCDVVKKTDMKNENLHPKILWHKIKGDTLELKNYQFTIDTAR